LTTFCAKRFKITLFQKTNTKIFLHAEKALTYQGKASRHLPIHL